MKSKFKLTALLFTLTSLFSIPILSQNFNKEEEYLNNLSLNASKHIYADFLNDEFNYKQDIGFGSIINEYLDYKKKFKTDKSEKKVIIKHPYFNSIEYISDDNGIINKLTLEFENKKSYNSIKEKLNLQ